MLNLVRMYHPVESKDDYKIEIPYTRRTLDSLALEYGEGQLVVCQLNGQEVPRDQWKHIKPKPGTTIVIMPLVGFWPALGALIWQGAVYAAVGLGFSYLGGLLFAQDPPERKTYNDRQTRGWSLTTTATEGIPYQREYGGPFAAHGNAVAKWTDVNGDGDEVLHMILCFGDKGPSVGTVAGEMYIQDQPIGNYDGVTVTERYGTMDQTAIAAQNKLEIRPGTPVTNDDGAITITTSNNFADDLEYTIEFDRGLWGYDDLGERQTHGVGVKVEISETSVGSWTTLLNTTISDNQMTPIYKAYTVSDQGYSCSHGTQYDLRFTKTSADADAAKNGDSLKVRAIREVIDVAFTRPGKPLIYFEAVATEQLDSNMDVKVIRKGRLVRTYNGTSWSIEWSNNRADIWLDMVTQPVIVGNGDTIAYSVSYYDGLDPSSVNLSAWYEWRQWCADAVTDGDGGTEERMVYNGLLNVESDLWTVAYETAEIGRARTYWHGTTLDMWIDMTYTGAVDLITHENVMSQSWRNSWAQHSELAGKVTVFYEDAARGYKRSSLPIPNEDAGNYKLDVQLEGVGVTTASMATRVANYALYRNKLIRNINTVDMHKDAVRFDLGRVVRLQHNRPDWGAAYRIRTATSGSIIELNRTISASPGDAVYIRAYDSGEEDAVTSSYTVDTVSGTTLKLVETMSPTPTVNSIVAIGDTIPLRRIIKIEQSERPQYYTVTLETYDTTLFASDDFEPNIQNADYIVPTADQRLVRPVTRWEVRDMISQALPTQPNMDIPRTANITWTSNDPGAGSVSWAARVVGSPLLFNYAGTTYEITADDTTDEYIYWDPASTTTFQTTNDGATALDTGHWLMATNTAGVVHWATPMQLLHAGVILAGTIRADAYLELIENYVVNGWAACDSSYPFERGFDIVDTMSAITSVLLCVRIKPFRAYTTGAESGGGSTPTSSDGGAGEWETTGPANYSPSSTTGGMSATADTGAFDGYTDYFDTGHTHDTVSHSHTLTKPSTTANEQIGDFSDDTDNADGDDGVHKHGIQNADHHHDLDGTWSISSETPNTYDENGSLANHRHQMNNHVHAMTDHTHDFDTWGSAHTHDLTITDHTHTVTLANHTHDITFGIYEETNAITWHYHVDNGAGYGAASTTYNSDQRDLDITSLVTTSGVKSVKIDVDDLCVVEVDVKIKLEITA